MSDRTPSSVRTGARTGDAAAPADAPTGESPPVSATQAIPTTISTTPSSRWTVTRVSMTPGISSMCRT